MKRVYLIWQVRLATLLIYNQQRTCMCQAAKIILWTIQSCPEQRQSVKYSLWFETQGFIYGFTNNETRHGISQEQNLGCKWS